MLYSLRTNSRQRHHFIRVTRSRAALAGAVALTVCALSATAGEKTVAAAQVEQDLKSVRQRIKVMAGKIAETQRSRDRFSRSLERIELRYGETTQGLKALEVRIAAARANLREAKSSRRQSSAAASRQRASIAALLRTINRPFQHNRLRMVLNQDDPVAFARVMRYTGYIKAAYAARLTALRDRVATLQRTMAHERSLIDVLRQLEHEQKQTLARLVRQRAKRGALLHRALARLRHEGALLSRLEKDENRLSHIVSDLAEGLARLKVSTSQETPFPRQRGKLIWPVRGRLLSPGESGDGQTQRHRHGVLIASREGTLVHAVSHGRIAYSDWLRGYGLLVIVDHGDGYMSLYGHNRSISTEVGDWVNAGDPIGVVGDSGGNDRAALYFEIRLKARPQDPRRWCAGRPEPLAAKTASHEVSDSPLESLSLPRRAAAG